MSASTIARWNAISVTPQSTSVDPQITKRTRQEEEDSEDNISIVSRSPSPSPDRMDIDPRSHNDHGRRPKIAPEVITVETRIKPENKGFTLLAKMGWSEGRPLGLSGEGRVDPIPFHLKNDSTGIGKTTQDVRMIETTVSQRRGLDSERQQKETEDQRRAREDLVARKAALENEISTTLRAFYCELCDKQFKTVAQYDEHTNSYAHHHKARLRDMHVNARPTPKDEVDKRKEKERRREEKELRKIAAANGIKMSKPTAPQASTSSVSVSVPSSGPGMDTSTENSEPKKGGWAAVSSGFKKSNWTTSSLSHPTNTASWPPPRATSPPPSLPPSHVASAPSFRNAGWTSLETGSLQQTLPPQASPPFGVETPPPPSPPPTSVPASYEPQLTSQPQPPQQGSRPHVAGWKQFQTSMKGKTRR